MTDDADEPFFVVASGLTAHPTGVVCNCPGLLPRDWVPSALGSGSSYQSRTKSGRQGSDREHSFLSRYTRR